VVFCDGGVDIYNPKAVRASAGALFRAPVSVARHALDVLESMSGHGLRLLATAPTGGDAYTDVDLTAPTALVVGGESAGLSPAVQERVDGSVSIPMELGVESLNVAMAAAVLCFEASRQRRALAAR
jgi:TrmH family RNA methyltransferase